MYIVTSLILSVFVLSSYVSAYRDLIVKVPEGQLRGHTLKSSAGKDYYAFQEIPYAAPPVGEDRFVEPKSPLPWNGVRDATQNSKQCVQFQEPSDPIDSEDCLFLNVYSPEKPGSSDLLPVFLFIHGGAFVGGTGGFNSSNPTRFMDYGIVIVTINYRLGALGFIATGDDVIPGNLGLKDQAFAMKWVKSNIHLFGGDPNKVTIGGESAGAFSVGYQLLGLGNSGLFRGAVLESGSSVTQMGYSLKYRTHAFNLGKALDPNFQSNSSQDLLSLLRKASFQDLVAANTKVYAADDVSSGYVTPLTWLPVIEGTDAKNPFITSPMLQSFISGNYNRVPTLLGFNSEEALMFAGSPEFGTIYDNNPSLLTDERWNIPADKVLSFAQQRKQIYTSAPFAQDQAALVKLSSDGAFTTGMLRQAEEMAKYVPVYFYQFSYMGFKFIFDDTHYKIPGAEGVGHAEELFYMWDMVPPQTDSDKITINRMLLMWTNFVKYLNPTPEPNAVLNNVTWLPVENSNIQYLDIGENLEMKSSPRYYAQLRSLLLANVQPPYTVF